MPEVLDEKKSMKALKVSSLELRLSYYPGKAKKNVTSEKIKKIKKEGI